MVIKRYFCNPLILSVLISLLFIYSGIFKNTDSKAIHTLFKSDKVSFIYGKIDSSPVRNANGKYYSCKIKVQKTGGNDFISESKGNITVCFKAEEVESMFPGKLFSKGKKKFYLDSGLKVILNGMFFNGVFYVDSYKTDGYEKNIKGKINEIRAYFRQKFRIMMFSWKEAGGFLLALLSGSREYTEPALSEGFRKAGLSHILALSGMHLSMFSGIALFIGEKLGRKKLTYILQLISIVLFVWFAGLSPSLFRAFVCSSVILIQKILCIEKSRMLEVLCFSFITQSLIFPEHLYQTGFLLSYGALAGIVIFGEFFRKIYSFVFPKRIAGSLSASTGAQIITLPISGKMFGSIAPVGIVSGVMVGPLVTLYIYSGLIFIILGLVFPPLVKSGGFFMQIQYTLIKNLILVFSKFPGISFR